MWAGGHLLPLQCTAPSRELDRLIPLPWNRRPGPSPESTHLPLQGSNFINIMKVLQAVISNKKGQKKKIRARSHGASVVLTPACLWSPSRGGGGDMWDSQPAGAQGTGTCWLFISSFPQTIDTSSTQSSLTTTSLRPPESQPPNDHHCQTDKGGASFSRGLPRTTGAERSAQTELSHPRLYSTAVASQIEQKRVLVISSQKTKTDQREVGACSLRLCQSCESVCVVHVAL